jgi:hypothetical protein
MISLKDANIDMSKINISNTMDDIRKAEKELSDTLHFAMMDLIKREDELIKEDCIKLGCPIQDGDKAISEWIAKNKVFTYRAGFNTLILSYRDMNIIICTSDVKIKEVA